MKCQNVNSLVLSQISVTAYSTLLFVLLIIGAQKTRVICHCRTFVYKTPATENALSASTDDGEILSKYLHTNSRVRPRLPLDSNIAISLRMAASWDFSNVLTTEVSLEEEAFHENEK